MSLYLIGFFLSLILSIIAIFIDGEEITVGGLCITFILAFGSWYSIFLILFAILFTTTSIKDWDIWNMKIFN
jgi:heme/copper-type cytochrome/quinol oxidase subunit 4